VVVVVELSVVVGSILVVDESGTVVVIFKVVVEVELSPGIVVVVDVSIVEILVVVLGTEVVVVVGTPPPQRWSGSLGQETGIYK